MLKWMCAAALAAGLVAFGDSSSLRRLRQVLDDADLVGQPAPHSAFASAKVVDPPSFWPRGCSQAISTNSRSQRRQRI